MTDRNIHTTDEGVAIGGYDPVTYFTESEPSVGSPEHAHVWAGATWHFTSAQNAELFVKDPGRYAPQFGGHCAFSATLGRSYEASPTAWRIIDGQLYLLRDKQVRMLSHLFTGRIRKVAAASD